MFGNIKKNNVRGLGLKLRNDEYHDFMLYKGECYSVSDSLNCVAISMDANKIQEDGTWISNNVWSNAINNNVVLEDIGYTGVDNGLIYFRGDRVNNLELIDILTKSIYIPDGGNVVLKPISSCKMRHAYPYELHKNYVSLKGGFFQGFYKIEGKEYQVLPNALENEWNLEFVIRRREFDIPENTIITKYPENNGLFFFMGLRAENKFALYYNGNNEYVEEEYPYRKDNYISNIYDDGKNPDGVCSNNNLPFEEEYMLNDIVIDDDILNVLTTTDGISLKQNEYEVFETDNKHIFFNRTATGYTSDSWDSNIGGVSFTDIKEGETENKFLFFNRTTTGCTTGQMPVINNDYDIIGDLKNNAFALIVNNDGSVGYRYGISDCETDNGYSVVSERSKPNMVKLDEWVTINVRFSNIGGEQMKLYFYLNGNLVLVSKPLPIFNFRGLKDAPSKQQGVPYNISLGGGTQGLFDGIWLKDVKVKDKYFPLMKDFGGCFIGDIKSFRFYDCFRHYSDISNTVLL